ncbi:MAG: arsenate reductase family protein [Magnetospirillum sp.]|nr:arsenate reductase family protein [Magnetospirillum sp.]
MAHVIFYEKPGCANNTLQKRLLIASGHMVVAKDIIAEPWTPDRLRRFFEKRPVAEWFNPAAPRIKSGEVCPANLTESQALDAMCRDPLLIRRPLIEAENRRVCGFDEVFLATWIGLDMEPDDALIGEECPHRDGEGCEPVG